MPQAPRHLVIYIIVYQDMMVWKPGKLQSFKIEDRCVILYRTVHKSFVSTSFKTLCTYHLFPPPWGGGGATQGDFTANVDTGGGMLTENRNLGWG